MFSLKTSTWTHLDSVLFLVHSFPRLGLNYPWTSLMGLASCLLAPVWTVLPSLPPHVSLHLNVALFGMSVAIPFLCSPLPLFLDKARRKWIEWVFSLIIMLFFWMKAKGMGHYLRISHFPLWVLYWICWLWCQCLWNIVTKRAKWGTRKMLHYLYKAFKNTLLFVEVENTKKEWFQHMAYNRLYLKE